MDAGEYRRDIEALLEKYFPRDTDPLITRAFIADWLPKVIVAEHAELQKVARGRVALAFLGKNRSVLARIESPANHSKRLEDWYEAWRQCRQRYGLGP